MWAQWLARSRRDARVQSLRQLLETEKPVIAPSIYDGITAVMVRELGFKAAYIGSYATSATRYGLPDIGYIGIADMVDQVARLSAIFPGPIIVDGEGGWGNALHVARSVRELERAGASAVHIEDHEFGKHVGTARVIDTSAAVDKIKAALDGRDSDEFLIIGRSDAAGIEGLDAAIDRLLAFQEAGADALFLAATDLDETTNARLVENARVPLFVVNDARYSAEEHAARGAALVMYFAVTHFAAEAGIRPVLETLARTGSTADFEVGRDYQSFDRFLRIDDYRDLAKRYHLA